MSLRVVVRISRRLHREDFLALRNWLEHDFPGEWQTAPAPEEQPSLGVLDDVLIGLCTGVGTAGTDAARVLITDELKRLVARYHQDEAPSYEVSVEVPGDSAGDTAGDTAGDHLAEAAHADDRHAGG